MSGLLGNNATNARNMANFLAGSINNITALYFLTNPNNLSQWSDFRDQNLLTTKLVQNEFSSFVKDDYKLTKNLTLNLGLRWDYYGVHTSTRDSLWLPSAGAAPLSVFPAATSRVG